jgi:hypothetical protein
VSDLVNRPRTQAALALLDLAAALGLTLDEARQAFALFAACKAIEAASATADFTEITHADGEWDATLGADHIVSSASLTGALLELGRAVK